MSNKLGLSRRIALRIPAVKRLFDELQKAWSRIEELERAKSVLESQQKARILIARAESTDQIARANEELRRYQEQVVLLDAGLKAAEREVDQSERRFQKVHVALAEMKIANSNNTADLHQIVNSSALQTEKHLLGLSAEMEASLRSLAVRNQMSLAHLKNADIEHTTSDTSANTDALRSRWLDLLESSLTGVLFEDKSISPWSGDEYNLADRRIGRDWPEQAVTMIGTARMKSLRSLCEMIIAEGIEGDFLEAGVWRGGAAIYMSGIVEAYQQDRRVFVADSFSGLPPPNPDYPADAGDTHSEFGELAVSLEDVQNNFEKYGLLNSSVVFVKGWFSETLHSVQTDKLALLRLDGDMYESTIQTLEALYDKVVPGGVIIVDDYLLEPCAQAVNLFRDEQGIDEEIHHVDGAAIWWRKPLIN